MHSKLAARFGRLPTHLDLPDTDGKPVENTYQTWQTLLLLDSIRSHLNQLHPDGQYLIAGDLGIYYQITDPPLSGCKAPDWVYIVGVPPTAPDGSYRRSYVLWQELVRPSVVIEYVSDETRGQERDTTPETGKFWVYERALGVPVYIIYEPLEVKLEVYQMAGDQYELMKPDDRGFYYVKPLLLNIGLHYETYAGLTHSWLRWFDKDGEMLETNEEKLAGERLISKRERQRANQEKRRADIQTTLAEREKLRAEREKQHAEQEKQRADYLAARLRELGVDPGQV